MIQYSIKHEGMLLLFYSENITAVYPENITAGGKHVV